MAHLSNDTDVEVHLQAVLFQRCEAIPHKTGQLGQSLGLMLGLSRLFGLQTRHRFYEPNRSCLQEWRDVWGPSVYEHESIRYIMKCPPCLICLYSYIHSHKHEHLHTPLQQELLPGFGGPARSLKVTFECGAAEEVLSLDEPSRCSYAVARIFHRFIYII